MGDQPAVAALAAAQQRAAADLAGKPDRRDLPLPRGRAARLFGHGPEDDRGLDPGAPLQGGARRHRCHWLGRQDQDLQRHHRPEQADRLRPDPAAGPAGAQQQQHQCRRADGEFRAAGGGGARHRPRPLDGRHPQHDADLDQRLAGAAGRHRHGERRQRAAAWHRRAGRRRRHRAGDRADAPRPGEHADDRARAGRGGEDQHHRHRAARGERPEDLRPQRPDQRSRRTRCCTTWRSVSC